MSAPRRWSELVEPDFDRVIGPATVGLVPVGATEQHGPHLPTGTDTIIATMLCDEVSARTGAVVLPAVAVSCSYGHGVTLAGTLSMSPWHVASSVIQQAEWAVVSGIRRLLLINAHAGNGAALSCATDHLRLFRPDLQIGVVDWWDADSDVRHEMLADGDDVHANRAETSLMLALAPELVRLDAMASGDDPDRTPGLVFRYTASSLSTNGVTGRPSAASPELGRDLRDRVLRGLTAMVEQASREEPPLGPADPPTLLTSPRSASLSGFPSPPYPL